MLHPVLEAPTYSSCPLGSRPSPSPSGIPRLALHIHHHPPVCHRGSWRATNFLLPVQATRQGIGKEKDLFMHGRRWADR